MNRKLIHKIIVLIVATNLTVSVSNVGASIKEFSVTQIFNSATIAIDFEEFL
jgi:hypothetical protein